MSNDDNILIHDRPGFEWLCYVKAPAEDHKHITAIRCFLDDPENGVLAMRAIRACIALGRPLMPPLDRWAHNATRAWEHQSGNKKEVSKHRTRWRNEQAVSMMGRLQAKGYGREEAARLAAQAFGKDTEYVLKLAAKGEYAAARKRGRNLHGDPTIPKKSKF